MGLSKLNQLYRAVILDAAAHPHHKGKITMPTNQQTLHNPTCGDTVNLELRVAGGRIAQIGFTGDGCTISQASASMMADAVAGKTTEEALAMAKIFSDEAIGKQHRPAELAKLGDAQALTSIMQFPARIKCATLSWWALTRALEQDNQERGDTDDRQSK
ncbi:Fe-S cluster assembly sulfur transfer protein SufU [uncultured Limosilactobacillus sp.]|uniref:Fe-S cluster assembly sulfur transfer protein SufU n=1 Tax=uncultured Limosilactobacillus sp. TaxID=2837629 RepID=UPI0025E08D0E|nr:SUF system NifU family Fe-S cluster assembly protein [uncultured Limosilactobacillus sp.]